MIAAGRIRHSSSRWSRRHRAVAVAAATLVGIAVLELGAPWAGAEKANETKASGAFRQTTPGGLAGLALPGPYSQLIQDRLTIDSYQMREHGVAPSIMPSARPRYATPPRVENAVRVIHAPLPPAVRSFRAANEETVVPPRGFRAPILGHQIEAWRPRLETNAFDAADHDAARLIEQRLASDGLIPTLAKILLRYGPESALGNPTNFLRRLAAAGYPTDLLRHFRPTDAATPGPAVRDRATWVVQSIAARQIADPGVKAAVPGVLPLEFDFQPSVAAGSTPAAVDETPARFEIATESGEHDIGLVRMQVGGGWRDGILPGGSLDVVGQMVDQFRSADFLISVPADAADSIHALITNSWRLRRPGQVTLCAELLAPSAWAQDNGKAGTLRSAAGRRAARATLAPRFACMDEGKSVFLPGESYLADGWQAAGHSVIHSPLLFQGGNVACIRDPRSGRRLLILGEGTMHRNVALGFSRAEVLNAFRVEFGVDECVVIPGVSYHLDFDVSFRATTNELFAFVNDTPAAARRIVELGVGALRLRNLLTEDDTVRIKAELASGQAQAGFAKLSGLVRQHQDTGVLLPASLSQVFVADSSDDAAGNLQVFLLALDLIESEFPGAVRATGSPGRSTYLTALRHMEQGRQNQIAALQKLNCRIVLIPSMHDLYRSINYLNGLQHRGGYVMPSFGGFYAPLDQAAAAAFQAALGADFRITTVRTSECQRLHGGVHCTASIYP